MLLKKQSPKLIWVRKSLFWMSLLLVAIASMVWRNSILSVFPYEYDEGIHLVLARVLAAGYEPYREAFVSYPPLFAWSLQFPYQLFHTAESIQLFMALFSVLGIIAIALIADQYAGPVAGIAAAILMSFLPDYFIPSRAVMGEIASIGLATFGVALTEFYRRNGHWYWVLLAGVAFSASISMKALPVFGPVLLGLVILGKHLNFGGWSAFFKSFKANFRALVGDTVLSLLGFSTFLLWPLLFVDIQAFYDQVLGMRFASRDAFAGISYVTNGDLIIQFLSQNPILVVFSLFGIVFVAYKRFRDYGFLFLWFLLTLGTMYALVPLRLKHLPILIPPLAVWAGFAVQFMFDWFKQRQWRTATLRAVFINIAILFSLFVLMLSTPQVVAKNQGKMVDKIEHKSGRNNAIWRANLFTSPRDCIVSDDPVLLFATQRMTAPELSEVSITRISTGYLTTQDVIDSLNKRNCQVVIVATKRFKELLPDLTDRLTEHYLLVYKERWQDTYAIKKNTNQQPLVPLNSYFVNGMELVGVDIFEENLQSTPSQPTRGCISFYWRLHQRPDILPKFFIHFRDQAGNTVFQVDKLPFNGALALEAWPSGVVLKDTVWFELPPEFESQLYNVFLGLYDPVTMERIPVMNDSSGENAIFIPGTMITQ